MAERQLAELLVSTGLDRKVDIERIASDLANITLPGYVDKTAFQIALLEVVESQLYRQTDERIRLLRQQLAAAPGVSGQIQANPQPEPRQAQPEPAQEPADTPGEQAPALSPFDQASYEEHDTTMVEAEEVPEEVPEDATMIWKARDQSF